MIEEQGESSQEPGNRQQAVDLRVEKRMTPEDRRQALIRSLNLPPDFEDTYSAFCSPDGVFLKFLTWDPPQLQGDVCA